MAPPLFFDTVLKMMYGLVAPSVCSCSRGSCNRPGIWVGGTPMSQSMSACGVLVRICEMIPAWLPVSDTSISLTYALSTGSADAFHAGLRLNTIEVLGLYDLIMYGPSDGWCVARAVLLGR